MTDLAKALYLDGVDISPDDIDMLIGTLDGRHGWKLVPVEPTEEMAEQGRVTDSLFSDRPGHEYTHEYKCVYRDMLAVSPDPLEKSND